LIGVAQNSPTTLAVSRLGRSKALIKRSKLDHRGIYQFIMCWC